ncbi:NAD(P)/FAD-dependent oxidoreductase [Evansella clarkii]|uniref:NAD(P)/FAD-dependent oxidoreductase n=1 Tax=Evansella clarkii TaxID=79879 RepID=UPI000996DFDB|nr:FAD-dependent oxidoreductase [Evansella clarkii]
MMHVIIIGGGILGASTAYHLAKSGHQVTVVDRSDAGQATDAAAGIICPWLSQRRNKAWYRLVKNGAKYYPELIKMLEDDGETDTGYTMAGALALHRDEEILEDKEKRAYKKREDAPEIGTITKLTPEETKAMFPPVSDEFGAIHVTGGARVNGRELRNALTSAAKKNGAVFVTGSAELVGEGNKITGVKTNGEVISGDKVIVAAGAWAGELFEPLGIKFLVTPQKAQLVHLEIEEKNTNHWPVVMPPKNHYLIPFENGRIIAGATHEDDAGFDTRITAGGLYEVFDKALGNAPGLTDSTLVETRSGLRPYTPGHLPVIGKVPGLEGVFTANGLGASGLTAGPYLGAELAKLATGEEIEINLSDYDIGGAVE